MSGELWAGTLCAGENFGRDYRLHRKNNYGREGRASLLNLLPPPKIGQRIEENLTGILRSFSLLSITGNIFGERSHYRISKLYVSEKFIKTGYTKNLEIFILDSRFQYGHKNYRDSYCKRRIKYLGMTW